MGAPGAKYEDQLMLALDDASPMVVKEACTALGKVAEATSANPAAAEKVCGCLAFKHPGVKGAALKALGKMKDEATAYIEDIVKCCNDPVAYIRYCAIESLLGCGELGQMYASCICKLLYDPTPQVRMAAISALASMGQRGAGFADEVASLLGDESPDVRKEALAALGAFGSESWPHKQAVMDVAAGDPYEAVQLAAEVAAGKIPEP